MNFKKTCFYMLLITCCSQAFCSKAPSLTMKQQGYNASSINQTNKLSINTSSKDFFQQYNVSKMCLNSAEQAISNGISVLELYSPQSAPDNKRALRSKKEEQTRDEKARLLIEQAQKKFKDDVSKLLGDYLGDAEGINNQFSDASSNAYCSQSSSDAGYLKGRNQFFSILSAASQIFTKQIEEWTEEYIRAHAVYEDDVTAVNNQFLDLLKSPELKKIYDLYDLIDKLSKRSSEMQLFYNNRRKGDEKRLIPQRYIEELNKLIDPINKLSLSAFQQELPTFFISPLKGENDIDPEAVIKSRISKERNNFELHKQEIAELCKQSKRIANRFSDIVKDHHSDAQEKFQKNLAQFKKACTDLEKDLTFLEKQANAIRGTILDKEFIDYDRLNTAPDKYSLKAYFEETQKNFKALQKVRRELNQGETKGFYETIEEISKVQSDFDSEELAISAEIKCAKIQLDRYEEFIAFYSNTLDNIQTSFSEKITDLQNIINDLKTQSETLVKQLPNRSSLGIAPNKSKKGKKKASKKTATQEVIQESAIEKQFELIENVREKITLTEKEELKKPQNKNEVKENVESVNVKPVRKTSKNSKKVTKKMPIEELKAQKIQNATTEKTEDADLQEEIRKLKEELSQTKSLLAQEQNKEKQIQQNARRYQEQLKEKERKNEDLKKQIESLEEQNESQMQAIKDLKLNNKKLVKQTKAQEQKQKEIDELKEQVAQLEDEKKQMEESLEKVIEENDDIENMINYFKDYQDRFEENANLTHNLWLQLDDLQQSPNNDLQWQLNDMQKQLSKIWWWQRFQMNTTQYQQWFNLQQQLNNMYIQREQMDSMQSQQLGDMRQQLNNIFPRQNKERKSSNGDKK